MQSAGTTPQDHHRAKQAHTTVQSVCTALCFFACGTFLYSVGDADGLDRKPYAEIRRVYLAPKNFLNIFVTSPGHYNTQRIEEASHTIAGIWQLK